MKRIIILVLCLFAGYSAYGQDLIVTVSGDSLNCRITEVKADAIFFSYDAGGNVVSLPMNHVASYRYDFYKSRRSTPAVAVSMRGRSEISVYAGGGLSKFLYETKQGPLNYSVGGMFGIGYTWFFSGRWGFVTGLEASMYSTEYNGENDHRGTYEATSSAKGKFEFSYLYQDYSEKQSALFLQIPAMAQFQTGRFFASAGIKIGFPVSTKYEATCTNFSTIGKFGNESPPDYINNDKTMGLSNFGAISTSDSFETSLLGAVAFEAGGQWFLGKRTNLYAGVWLDYTISNLAKYSGGKQKQYLVDYDPTVSGCLKYNSILDTNYKFNAMSAGLKIKFTFSL